MKRLILALTLLSAGCGSSDPASPSAPATAQLGGVWRGTTRVSTVSGGECFASTFQTLVGSSKATSAAVTQSGASLSVVVTDSSTGASCTYSGTTGASAVVLTLTSCTASDTIGARCTSGAVRDIRLLTSSINATASGTTMTGTEAETYNVNVSGTSTGVGTLTITSAFTVTKQ